MSKGAYEICYEYRNGEMQAVYADLIRPECVRQREDGQPQVLIAGVWTDPPPCKVIYAESPSEALRLAREQATAAGILKAGATT